MGRTRRLYSVVVVGAVAMLAFAGQALAVVSAPTFSVSTLSDPIYTLAGILLAGIAALLVVVLAVKGPFLLVNMALRAINKVLGRGAPKAA